ncbi:amidohydrolase [Nocardioides sp.]|uniref:amidohydrolase n=1 Tax=Nocardioides sp. TaxID=35761 RepID=UPI002D7F49F4|nr:amidohydrolase [Nocardioides sp.]HET8960967.1 amidohydrolase [Nocardioides sp.]
MSDTDPVLASRTIEHIVEKYAGELVELRRDLHAHPELSWAEERTTRIVATRLAEAGARVTRLDGTGLVAEVGDGGPIVALRADLDALPVEDTTGAEWASVTPGVAHACGHDVHTAGLVGSALALAEAHARGQLPGVVRFFFQPAEEVMPGGALRMMEAGALDDVIRIFSLHCDPTLDVGEIGLRDGPLTGAADALSVELTGRGGHTSRPHLTEDLTFALGKVVTELPAIVSRRLDPRAGVSLVWGMVRAGSAPNVIPGRGQVAGTVRMLDAVAWAEAEALVRGVIDEIVSPYGVEAVVDYRRGVPPVINDPESTRILGRAIEQALGPDGRVATTQSLGGEDFGWFLDRVPGAMARLGTRTPGGPTYDLHQGNLLVDDRAAGIAARVLAEAALGALVGPSA